MANGRESGDGVYDVLIVGAGQAGIPLAHALAKRGFVVGLAERQELGGSCVNFGCTPTKAVIASARVAQLARRADEFGLTIPKVEVDFARVLDRARGVLTQSRIGLRKRLQESANPELLWGHARFQGRQGSAFRLRVGERAVVARRVVLDTGTRTLVPRIPGLDEVDFIEAGNWLDHAERPEHLAVLGAGFIGLEMAQFYRRMGCRVTVIERQRRVAGPEDEDVADALRQFLEAEGITFRLQTRVTGVGRRGPELRLGLVEKGRRSGLSVSHLFVATGRRPNTGDLGLTRIGVEVSRAGYVVTDSRLATSVRGIWAAGDIRGGPLFTHTAWDDYRVLLAQLAGGEPRTTDRVVPYAIFTDPQLGRVGMTQREAERSGRRIRIGRFEMRRNGRARELGETGGFIKVIADARTRRILGAAVLAAEGAELVHLFVDLMNAKAPYAAIRGAVHIHPTLAEAVQSSVEQLA